jgi:thiol oxidase
MIALFKRAVGLLALALLLVDRASADQFPHLLEITTANFTDSLTEISKDYDWVLMEFYAHWSVYIVSLLANLIFALARRRCSFALDNNQNNNIHLLSSSPCVFFNNSITHFLICYYRCPVCKAFQPTYIDLAAHFGSRGNTVPRIAVGRVDCADNAALCDKFGIRSYPTMYLGTAAQFNAYEVKSLVHINPQPRTKENIIAAISKELGGVALDAELSITDSNPSSSGNSSTIMESNTKMKSSLDNNNNSNGDSSAHLRVVKPMNFQQNVDLNDVEGAVVKSWEYLTAPSSLRGIDTREALEDWIDLLADSHPVERCREGAENAAEVLISAWPPGNEHAAFPAALNDVKICGDTQFQDWTGCKGSLPSSRGYTCALWQLFHTLGARLPENDARSGARWMTAIRGFATHFFQCSDCARNFVKHASMIAADQVQSKKEAVLWMWATHNLVNARLKSEEEEASVGDPEYPKIQWPPEELCSSCSSSKDSSEEGGKVWNEDAVYELLLKFYNAGGDSGTDGGIRSGLGGKNGLRTAHGLNGVVVKQGNFYTSWEFAFILVSGVGGTTYFFLKGSGQYNFRKSLNRRI